MDEARKVLGDAIAYAPSAERCLSQSSVAIVINPMKEFAGSTGRRRRKRGCSIRGAV